MCVEKHKRNDKEILIAVNVPPRRKIIREKVYSFMFNLDL